MRGPHLPTSLARLLAVATVLVAVVLPLGGLLVASLRVREVTLVGGFTHRVTGYVVREGGFVRYTIAPEGDPDAERVPVTRPETDVVSEREAWSLHHYRLVLGSRRLGGLLQNSLVLAGGAALLALVLGLPIALVAARVAFPGRRVLLVLLGAPLLLPPFFAAMGVSTSVGPILAGAGLSGGTLQLVSSIVCLGGLLAPIPALLVGRAMLAVPAGLVEAALLAGGRRAARRAILVPALAPAAVASGALVFVLAFTDFAVPDLLGVFLPDQGAAVHVFATEVFLQWKQHGNVGGAVATGVPFVLVVLALLLVAWWSLSRAPGGLVGTGARERPLRTWHGARALLPWLTAAPVLLLGLVLPLRSVAAWGFSPAQVLPTVRATAGLLDDTERWLRLALLAALVATAVAVVLVRASRGSRAFRTLTGASALLSLSAPGLVLMVATLLLWLPLRERPNSLLMGGCLLVGRFLPHAVLVAGLALRDVDARLEDAARAAGAGPLTVWARVTGPLAARGLASAFLLVLVFALRELDGIQLVAPGIVPVRIYDKVHWGRTADVANLSMAYLGLLLLPALLAALLWPRRGEARGTTERS